MNNNATNSLINSGNLFFPEALSDIARSSDTLFFYIFWASTIFFIALIGITAYFIMKYKRTETNKKASAHIIHNNKLELMWTIIPTIIVMIIFYWGFKDFLKFRIPPSNALEIHVIGKKWLWEFQYSSGIKTIGELVIPQNRPIKLIMTSKDVLHSFYIPNLRQKKDIVPNRYTSIWFSSEKTGNYQIFCTEYCGDAHSNMLATLKVLPKTEFDKWIETGGGNDKELPLDELGEKLYVSKGCNACHSIDGSSQIGPTWKKLWKKKRILVQGNPVIAEENYLKESIINPQAKVVKGYAPSMPSYAGLLSDREITAIITYIKTLK